MTDRALNGFWISGLTELDEAFSFAQDLPNDDTDPVSHGPDGLHVSEADDQFFKDTLQVAVVGPGGSLSCLTQQTPIQEANCSAEGKAAASGPISARISCAASAPIPGISIRLVTASWKRSICAAASLFSSSI